MPVFSVSQSRAGGTLIVRAHGNLFPEEVPHLVAEGLQDTGVSRVQIDLHDATFGPPSLRALAWLAMTCPLPIEVVPGLVRYSVERAAIHLLTSAGGPAAGAVGLLYVVDADDRIRFMNAEARAEAAARGLQQGAPWELVCPLGAGVPGEARRKGGRVQESLPGAALLVAEPVAGGSVAAWVQPPAADAAEGRRQSLVEIAARAAHEIRNPLATIRAGIELLQGRLADTQDAGMLAVMLQEIDRLSRLVDQYLTLSRTPSPRRVNAAAVLASSLQFLAQDPHSEGVTTRVREVGSAATVLADPERLRQVFLNVLLNAIEAVRGQGTLEIEVERDHERREVTARIRDSGPGFAPEYLEAPFVAFRTSKPRGTGLGLVISNEIVTEDGGRLELRNASPGPGAEVAVVLPMAPPE